MLQNLINSLNDKLNWYKQEIINIPKYLKENKTDALLAIINVLSLDKGTRLEKCFDEINELKTLAEEAIEYSKIYLFLLEKDCWPLKTDNGYVVIVNNISHYGSSASEAIQSAMSNHDDNLPLAEYKKELDPNKWGVKVLYGYRE